MSEPKMPIITSISINQGVNRFLDPETKEEVAWCLSFKNGITSITIEGLPEKVLQSDILQINGVSFQRVKL